MELFAITKAILAIVFAYLVGSIPIGLIVARITRGIDIREHGSGNIGLTNVIRTIGWGPGLVTGVLDFFKGYLPVILTMTYFNPQDFGSVNAVYEAIVVMVAAVIILGNLYPVFLLFKGGKGVATGLGVMTAIMGVFIFIPIVMFGIILLIFRFVSLASIAAAFTVPLTVLVYSSKLPFISRTIETESTTAFGIISIFTWVTAILIFWRHRSNIARIIKGVEPRIGKPREPTLQKETEDAPTDSEGKD